MYSGSCLCGGVRYEIDAELGDFGYCHCRSCQKASGSAFAANASVDRAKLRLTGAGMIREFESSPGKLRAFCTGCGSPIYAYLKVSPDVLRIRLGTLDTPFARQPSAHIWVCEAAPWSPITDGAPQFERWAPRQVLHLKGSRQDQEV
jgi:hypothetical protein